jgi:NNP family nitrate/nitrite transporter-like MFS transporter
LCEGFALVASSRASVLPLAIAALIAVGLFVKMANGAAYGVVPFVSRRALGSVAGIVGSGGNAGAVAMGFLFRAEGVAPEQAFLWLGAVVAFASMAAFVVSLLATDEERGTARPSAETAA